MSIHIGIDTSNYTTSVAALDGEAVCSLRRLLPVQAGQRGLRQSDAVFQHMKQMPALIEELAGQVCLRNTKAVGVSVRPRNVEGSYMPVFLAGEGFARAIAQTLGVPLYRFSHQDGHMMAGIYSANAYAMLEKPFISVHLSGGTTEILKSQYKDGEFISEIIGGTKDISAGQLIDRVGVACGLLFPCGREMESLAAEAETGAALPVHVDGSYINFSGTETKALRMASQTAPPVLFRGVLAAVAYALEKALNHVVRKTGCRAVLFVGGVAANLFLREYLIQHVDADITFAQPEYATDNAAGIAVLCRMKEK